MELEDLKQPNMGRTSNLIVGTDELIDLIGDEFGSLKKNNDGTWTAKQKNGAWFTEPKRDDALGKLALHVKVSS